MYKLCKTEQSAARQRALEAGLLSVMLTRRYEDISISDLCAHLQIPRKSFYRYFSSKDGALHALLDHTLLEYDWEGDLHALKSGENAVVSLERFFQFWHARRNLLNALQKSDLTGILVLRAISQAQEESQVPQHFLDFRSQEQRNLAISFAITGLMTIVLQWHTDGFRQSSRKMAELATDMLSKPLIKTF